MRVNLTVRKVQSLKPPQHGQADYWDDSVPGFGVRVAASGRKSWTVYYRYHKRKRRLSLGTFPTVPLVDARERARAALNKVAAGEDPAAEKILSREAGTLGELVTEYLQRHAKRHKKSWRNDQWMIDRHMLPRWRHVKARDVSRPDVRALIESVADGGAPILANRLLALVRKMFNFAIEREWRSDNPCQGLRPPGVEKGRDRVLSDGEIKKIWDALEPEQPPMSALFRLRMLTAQRGGEVRRMRWENVDLKTGWWTIPAEFAKNGIAHHVPLNAPACEILKELREWQETRLEEVNDGRRIKKWEPKKFSEWVFPSPRGDEPFQWEQRAVGRIRAVSGVDFRPHDLRRTVATLLTEHQDADRFILKRILNHVDRDITGVYDRNRYDAQKRTALDAWGRRLRSIVEEKDVGSNVVPDLE
ncbi:MAG: integrase arm-type DNA-binding domain-containing protein [Acidobacteriota bacterium]